VTFHVRLVDDPEADLVCEVVQSWVVQLVGCAYGVDVVALHEHKIFFHELVRHSTTEGGMVFMAIDSAENDSLSIDFNQAIFHLDLSETDALSNDLVVGVDHKMVKVRRFSSPFQRIFDLKADLSYIVALDIRF
jgi:hypothetical protein